MGNCDEFRPDWVSAPGDTILDILRQRRMSENQFASIMGLSAEDADHLLSGRSSITMMLARKLAEVVGASVEFWMYRDYLYRHEIERIFGTETEWLSDLPVGDMIRFGWLQPVPHPTNELEACLNFFDVSSVLEWHQRYEALQTMTAFRTSRSFDNRPTSVAAWLRQGEIEAGRIECENWNPEGFLESLGSLRTLTKQKDPSRFIPIIQEVCAGNGVAVVIVRSPGGCRASGATRFVGPGKSVLQLSFRYLTDDHFWFTFFHEAGHLVLHGNQRFFASVLGEARPWILEGLSGDGTEETEEEEANQFASSILIPDQLQPELMALEANQRDIVRFARRSGISPGIVVGQMQHRGRIPFDQMNQLKRRFAWEGDIAFQPRNGRN